MSELTEKSSAPSGPFLVRSISIPSDLGEVKPVEATQPPLEVEERPIEAYERSTGRPYIADILEMQPVYGHSGYEDQAQTINDFVLEEIADRNLKSTKESYRQVVQELEGMLGLEGNLEYDSKLERLGALVTMLSKAKQLKQLQDKYGE